MQHLYTQQTPRSKTREISVGGILMGHNNPVVVQSMLAVDPCNVSENLRQIERLAESGCEIVRIAVPRKECLDPFKQICDMSPLPIVADIHFKAEYAIEAALRGASKLRINPGNIGGPEKTIPVLETAKSCGIPIRIGVNAGSLDKEISEREDLTHAQKLAQSARDWVQFCESEGFYDLVVSAKAHDVLTTVEAYRELSRTIPHIPLHIGITEAGTINQGLVKSACGLGILLSEGIGDTLRISLTDDPVREVKACWDLLASLELRRRGPEIISCPTCGRCQVDLIPIAQQVEERLSKIDKPLKVAVMGCVVNGPGEAASADIGVACGKGKASLFKGGKSLRTVDENAIVESLLEEIERL